MGIGRSFDEAYEVWFAKHLAEATGERKSRLLAKLKKQEEDGEDYPEKLLLRNIWWPAFETLEHVHPEYEVVDFCNQTRFLDQAIVQYPLLVDLEGDGYGPHLKEISRWEFRDERRRDIGLEILGWNVIRFAYDDVRKDPLLCQHLLKNWMKRWTGALNVGDAAGLREREIVKLALAQGNVVQFADVMRVLSITDKPAKSLMKGLAEKQIFTPIGNLRIHAYALNREKGLSMLL